MEQSDVIGLRGAVEARLFFEEALAAMRAGASRIAKPGAADDIAAAMIEAAS